MKKCGKTVTRFLTVVAIASALVLPIIAPAVASADESTEPTPYAIIESVVDTFKSETCLTSSSHYWEGSRTYRNITFHTSYAWDHRDVVSQYVDYPCHYQANHRATYTTWKNYYRTW